MLGAVWNNGAWHQLENRGQGVPRRPSVRVSRSSPAPRRRSGPSAEGFTFGDAIDRDNRATALGVIGDSTLRPHRWIPHDGAYAAGQDGPLDAAPASLSEDGDALSDSVDGVSGTYCSAAFSAGARIRRWAAQPSGVFCDEGSLLEGEGPAYGAVGRTGMRGGLRRRYSRSALRRASARQTAGLRMPSSHRPSHRPPRTSIACVAIMLLSLAAMSDAAARTPSLKRCLQNAANGGGPLPAVVYSDAHGLWGGTTIALDADGGYRRDRVDPREPPERVETVVDAVRHRALAGLLVELKAWKQRVPERRAVPDESRAGLTIRCGAAEARIWEWYNALAEQRRILRVREALRAVESPGPTP